MSEEVEYTSWGGRIMESIKGVLVGLVLFVASFPLLFWNEGRAVKTAQGLEEGQAGVVTISPEKVDSARENKLVYLTGPAVAGGKCADAATGIEAPGALRLARRAEMFQWQEKSETRTEKELGGSTRRITTYTHHTDWSEKLHESGKFREPLGHANPVKMELSSISFEASPVTIGAFLLPQEMLRTLTPKTPLPITEAALAKLPEAMRTRAKIQRGQIYLGADPGRPQVGDLRVTYTTLPVGPVSLVARQMGNSFGPYLTKAGTELSMIDAGTVPADLMFKHAADSNKILTWILRGVGWFAMALGLGLVFGPIKTVADVLPFLGDILGIGIAVFAGIVSIVLSLVTIAIAWLAYRPVLGVGLIAAAVVLLVLFKSLGRKKRPAPAA